MLTIKKGDSVKAVTAGAYKSMFEGMGYKIVHTKSATSDNPEHMKKPELITYAEDLGIDLDGEETVKELKAKIAKFEEDKDPDDDPDFADMDRSQLEAFIKTNEYDIDIEDFDDSKKDEEELRKAVVEAYKEEEE